MKTDIETVEAVLAKNQIEESVRRNVIRDIQTEIEASKKPKGQNQKKQFVIVAFTEDKNIKDIPMFVVQIPEENDPNTIIDNMKSATIDFNMSKGGCKNPVEKLGESFEIVARKFFTQRDIHVKTKEPVWVVQTENLTINNKAE